MSARSYVTLEKQLINPASASGDSILVDWEGQDDFLNPADQSVQRKQIVTFLVSLIALSATATSATDACGTKEYSGPFEVSGVLGSLATGTAEVRL
ncbi:uncharacterized protein BDW43DRAFT_312138 [Aspergillus alliaceus]|uniref:uncharacterized protein n=1 Tax=Petromyces alliaceus TaxID=209559 RepID=UPI0012A720A5|nr:uncharacterized protein BDW43DRAFT_312138 [Aspergillus alliaceus]KAB8232463.1 hypothetical protein BDW43DRAFT_312138 [Aspergillus alliaceus]